MSDTVGTSQAQCVYTNCTVHEQEELDMYCKDCKLPICIDCVKQDHKDHAWDRLKRVAQQIRAVNMSSENSANRCLNDLQKVQDLLNSFEAENCKLFVQNSEKIQKRSKELVMAVEKEADKMIEKLKTKMMMKNNQLQEQKKKTATQIEQIQGLLKMTKDNAMSMSDHVLLDVNTKNEKVLAEVNTEVPKRIDFIDTSHYTKGDVDTKVLTAMMGRVHVGQSEETKSPQRTEDPRIMCKLTHMSKFTHGTEIILSVFPIDDDHAWVHSDVSQENHLVDKTGQVIKTRSLQGNYCASFFVQDNGDQVFTFSRAKKIQNISADGKLTTLVDTTPLYPWGITKTQNGDLLVTLTDNSKTDYSPNKESKRLVQLMSISGKVKKTYKHSRDSKEVGLFTWPFRVVQNNNMDICIVDQTSADTGRLCVLCENGEVRFIYSKQHSNKYFHITDVCCDEQCNIIVIDYSYDLVHLLSPSGQFLKYLLSKDGVVSPYSIAFRNNMLWIGCATDEDQLYVFKMEMV